MAGAPPVLEEDAEAAWELFVFGVEEPPPAAHGDAESATWFRTQLLELGFTQGAFARFMVRRGDTRPKRNVLRSIQRMCAGQARVPGEMRVLLGLMLRSKQRKMARAARQRDEREAPWNDLSEARAGRGERGVPDAPGSDLPETHAGQAERGAPDAPGSDLSEARRPGRAGGDGGDLSEARGEPPPDSKTAGP